MTTTSQHDLNPERTKAVRWVGFSVALGVVATVILLPLAWPITLAFDRGGVDAAWVDWALRYFTDLPRHPAYWLVQHVEWVRNAMRMFGHPPTMLLAPFGAGVMVAVLGVVRNPHRFDFTQEGSARFADERDLKDNQLFDRCGFVFGRWGNHPSRGKLIRSWNPFSMALISPPGTGKTVLLAANVLADHPDDAKIPGPSMIINDPKGELYRKTGGWRSKKGPVFKVAWGEQDGHRWNPVSPRNFVGGAEAPGLRADMLASLEEIYVDPIPAFGHVLSALQERNDPRGEVLADPDIVGELRDGGSPASALPKVFDYATRLQEIYSEREKAVDSMCVMMVSDKVGPHWCTNGRAALAGFLLYEISRAEYEGREPTIGKMLEWLNTGTIAGEFSRNLSPVMAKAGEEGDPEAGVREGNGALDTADSYLGTGPQDATGGDVDDDKVAKLLEDAINEAMERGYPARVVQELNGLRIKPERERGSVISTAGGSLGIFKNAAVRRATSRSDFSFDDLRGMHRDATNPRGRPVTVYVVTKLKDAGSLGLVTGLLIDQAAAYLISQDEDEVQRSGRPVWMLCDEFWTLPKGMESIPQIPALGRSYWVAIMLVGQSWGQVAIQMGREAMQVLKGAINYTVLFTQNDRESAEDASKTIGNMTVMTRSTSRAHGLGKGVNPFQKNISTSFQSRPLLRPEDVMSMEILDPKKRKWGRLLFLMVGMKNKPIMCRPPIWFKDRTMSKRQNLPLQDWPAGEVVAPPTAMAPAVGKDASGRDASSDKMGGRGFFSRSEDDDDEGMAA